MKSSRATRAPIALRSSIKRVTGGDNSADDRANENAASHNDVLDAGSRSRNDEEAER